MNFLKKNLVYVIILILGLTALIWAGFKFFNSSNNQDSQNSNNKNEDDSFEQKGQFGERPGFGRGNFKPINGTITSIDNETIVIKTDEESKKNIICSSETRIMKQENEERTALSCSDLEVGDEIHVMSDDSEGSNIQARMIFVGEFQPPERPDSYPPDADSISNDSITS